jgi:hypothetical protein
MAVWRRRFGTLVDSHVSEGARHISWNLKIKIESQLWSKT